MVSKENFRAGNIEIIPKALVGHKKHGDMYPIPKESCPIEVYHATGSTTNPYEVMDIGASGLGKHKKHGNEVMQFVDTIL
jgi:hypothetical protein